MKVTIVKTRSGRRLHILGAPGLTLCGGCPEQVVFENYELTNKEPKVEGRTGICKTCRQQAIWAELDKKLENRDG